MQLFDTMHKRKSAAITLIILLLLLFAMYGFGMKYMNPPIEYGVLINYGESNVGSGEPVEKVKTVPPEIEKQQEQEEITEEQAKEPSKEETEEEITDDATKDVPEIEKKEVKEETKPKKSKPSKATTNALNSLLEKHSADGERKKEEGDDTQSGMRGDKDRNPDSTKYYENTSGGFEGNYNLAGRKVLSKPIQKPDCQEEGKVVVSIKVNKDGNVIEASPGVRGTTSSASCLLKAAKEAALKTKWNPDGNAPDKQKGTIIYKFSLSK